MSDLSFGAIAALSAKLYPFSRKQLFKMDAEDAHHFSMKMLSSLQSVGLTGNATPPGKPVKCMGLTFPNAVGLGAGLDKDGVAIDALGGLGFGAIEIGTLTPKPQPGNDAPRLFRIIEAEGIINRMGFNNDGIDAALPRARARRYKGILGINIGKNKVTPNENAVDDYLYCFRAAADTADYITVNFSSPNTPGLRDLQSAEALTSLLAPLKDEQKKIADKTGKYTPIAVKIAPDLDDDQLASMAKVFKDVDIDCVIATNTTISRDTVEGMPHASETGGLSGAPVRDLSTAIIRKLRDRLDPEIPIIGVGGITRPEDAVEKIQAGAAMVQIYSGFIFKGPKLIQDSVRALANL
ncbi:quinone-dependent dihydroorotate dehydrogenase [Sulfuriroseicoccus oceanibius]|uniref:Dihydroorotate dehydrogenase (quinone) n=1 Tax=Sulfuriroseicoccus oceanibius TaxID=2707525 RepID=A0A6B3LDV5_9BACT|nr:quinone-dependent dihydroorotate dehydrogenase [Sulfuriroseicoccus oceanibius]QQL44463.1 quinone-dependent dihydroorotate dehydrogenase [Sulfuriroseicoccus oceanibius]